MTTQISGDTGVSQVQAGSINPDDLAQKLTLGTAQNTTSGTSIDFTGIPSWVTRITVLMCEVSSNGVAGFLVQVGSGSFVNSGYISTSNNLNQVSNTGGNSSTAGFVIRTSDSAVTVSGSLVLHRISNNTWVESHAVKIKSDQVSIGGGSITLAGALDRVRLTTVNGTDTFDGGSVNIMYEG